MQCATSLPANLFFAACLLASGHCASPCFGGELPTASKMLQALGYQVLESDIPSERAEKPEVPQISETLESFRYRPLKPDERSTSITPNDSQVEVEQLPNTSLRLVSSKFETPSANERRIGDPWVWCEWEFRYGEKELVDHDVKLPVRIHQIVIDADGNEVRRLRSGPEIWLYKGQPAIAGVGAGFQLTEPLESGTVVYVLLWRESVKDPWQLLSYQTLLVNHLERGARLVDEVSQNHIAGDGHGNDDESN